MARDGPGGPGARVPGSPSNAGRARGARPWLWLLGLLLALMLGHIFVVEPMRVPTDSMRPTLVPGEHVLVDKVTYRLHSPRRGELVVFELPDGGLALKRVIGLPGDRVAIRDGVLFVDGRRVQEGYVDYESVDGTFFGPLTVPRGQVFVLGDRRANSEDSRAFGPVPLVRVVGRAVCVVWPPRRLGRL